MGAATKLSAYQRLAYFQHPYRLSILLLEKSYSTLINSLLVWDGLAFHRQIPAYAFIGDVLYVLKLLFVDGLQMGEIKTKSFGMHLGASLRNMAAQHLTQRCLEKMCCRVIGADVRTAACVN